jgi:hypothetical protein
MLPNNNGVLSIRVGKDYIYITLEIYNSGHYAQYGNTLYLNNNHSINVKLCHPLDQANKLVLHLTYSLK